MHFERTVEVDAPPERVWAVMSDVRRWPEWTASVKRVEPLGSPEVAVSGEFRVEQPKIPRTVWRVTKVEPGRLFTWEAKGPGQHHVASHRIEPLEGGRSRVTLETTSTGLMVALMGPWIRSITQRYVQMEIEGLKRRSESAAPA